MKYINPADMPSRPEAEQRAFFEQALAASRQAMEAAGMVEYDMLVAGRRIRLQYAGNSLERLTTQAISPLFVPVEGEPDATLLLWDSAATGVEMPAPRLSNLCFSQRGDLWTFDSPRFRSAFHYWDYSLNLFDRESATGIFWLKDAAKLPSWTRAAPFRTLFHWLLSDHGLQLVHGAVVGTEKGGVLVCGAGGVGKSSTSLAALASGMRFVGDDYVVLSCDPEADDPIAAHCLFASAKVHFHDAPRFEAVGKQMEEFAPRSPDDKAVILPHAAVARSLPLKAIVTPRFGSGATSTFEPIDRDTLVMAGAFPSIIQLPHSGNEVIRFLEDVTRRIPFGRLVLGHDRAQVPDALRRLLDGPKAAIAEQGAVPEFATAQLVSVIVPAYNAEQHIADTIADILTQTHRPIEIIVVDDGSTDRTAQIVAGIEGPVRLVSQANAGPAAARNRGIDEARGSYLCFQDADDRWPHWKIAAALACFAEHPETDAVLGRSQLIHATQSDEYGHSFIASPLDTFEWSIGAAVFATSAFEKVGRFDAQLRFGEDTDWFERAADIGANVARLQDISLFVRRHQSNSTKDRDLQDIYPVRLIHKRIMRERMASKSHEQVAEEN